MNRWTVFGIGVFLSCVCTAGEVQSVRDQFGAELVKALEAAQSTETYRLSGDRKADSDPANWKKGPVWEAKRTQEIAAALLNDKNFVIGMGKRCLPRPGVMLRMISGASQIDLRLCFECSILEISCEAPKFATSLHFEASRSTWARWAKQAFPDDAIIQGLKEKDMPREEVERIQNELIKMRRELEEKIKKDGEKQ